MGREVDDEREMGAGRCDDDGASEARIDKGGLNAEDRVGVGQYRDIRDQR